MDSHSSYSHRNQSFLNLPHSAPNMVETVLFGSETNIFHIFQLAVNIGDFNLKGRKKIRHA